MKTFVFESLFERGFITEETLHNIVSKEKNKPVPLHTELKLLMYAGIILLTTGLGILIYKNIDSIGHLAIVIAISIATVSCFLFCYSKALAFSKNKLTQTNVIKDYTLLLGCLLMLILTGYLQFQYQLFGERWGMATFIPMIILFVAAYYFDHLGVLSMGIVNLAAWAGISVTPRHLLRNNDFNNSTLIYTATVLGLFLLFAGYISLKKNIKAHFEFTYKNFGIHILFIAAIAGIIHFSQYELLWLIFLAGISFWQFLIAIKEKSFYFLIMVYLYFYFGVSYVVVKWLFLSYQGEFSLYTLFLYFIITAGLSVVLLMRYHKILKQHVQI